MGVKEDQFNRKIKELKGIKDPLIRLQGSLILQLRLIAQSEVANNKLKRINDYYLKRKHEVIDESGLQENDFDNEEDRKWFREVNGLNNEEREDYLNYIQDAEELEKQKEEIFSTYPQFRLRGIYDSILQDEEAREQNRSMELEGGNQ